METLFPWFQPRSRPKPRPHVKQASPPENELVKPKDLDLTRERLMLIGETGNKFRGMLEGKSVEELRELRAVWTDPKLWEILQRDPSSIKRVMDEK